MTVLIRCIRSDFRKMKHTFLLWIHILLPAAVSFAFISYYSVSAWKTETKITVFLETLSIAFPLVIGLICGNAAEQEEQAGNYQVMLSSIRSKTAVYLGKLLGLLLLGTAAVMLAVGIFAAGFGKYPLALYGKAAGILLLGNAFGYVLHLFISLQYGKGASTGLGMTESLISALMLTGLGDRIWQVIPCAWGARISSYLLYIQIHPESAMQGNMEIRRGLLTAAAVFLAGLALSILWFGNWEGKERTDTV